jgi:outer membrane protein TolC
VKLAIEEAYFAVHAAKGVSTAAESAWQRAKLNFETAQAGVQAGMRKPIELTRASADLARFEVGRVRARAGVDAAQSLFAAVVGVPERALDAAGEATVAPAPPLEVAIDRAIAHDPLLRERRARLHEQLARTRAIGKELWPDLQATATVSAREGGAPSTSGTDRIGLLPQTPNWDVGLVFSWPLYDRVVREREDASQQLEEVRRAEVAEVEQRIGAGVTQASVDLGAAQQALPALERAVEASRANYDQANARFQAGLGTSVELADAQALLADSEVQLALGRFDVARARVRLGRVIAEDL